MSKIGCIVYPPTLDYHYLVQRPQHLMKNFSLQGISCLFMNMPGIYQRDFRGIEEINPHLFVFHEVDSLPYLQGIRPVVYYSATAQVDKVGRYDPALLVFDSVDEPSDEFSAWQPYYHRAVATADVVLCTSEKLYHMARAINPHTYLVPNGCDYEHFSRAARGELQQPYELKKLEGPIIGYIGVIATWCDLELIDRLAWTYPSYNLVMVGPLYNVGKVPQRPNLHWLGFRGYDYLPAYAQSFDVGIVPFRRSSMTESVNPIKMWEYLAAGLPVVTTALPEAEHYRDVIHYSEDPISFIENVRRAVENDSVHERAKRMALARQNSWSARSEEITRIIEHHLAMKHPDYLASAPRPSILPFREMLASQGGEYRKNTLISSSRLSRNKPRSGAAGREENPVRRIKSWRSPRYQVNPGDTADLPIAAYARPDIDNNPAPAELRFQKPGIYIDSRARLTEEAESWLLE